ncbi:MAG: alanine racemase, partial [Candidatus Kapaibacteriota bacterium]
EGIALREAGIKIPILVLVPENDVSVEASVDYDLDYAVERFEVVKAISSYAKQKGKTAKVHIYIDTGMGRNGISAERSIELVGKCFNLENINPIGIMSHFASSESDREYTSLQLQRFLNLVESLKANGFEFEMHHIANTGALFSLPESYLDTVRPGLALYGYVHNQTLAPFEFKPVMEIFSKVISLRRLKPGESVGYGRKFIATKETTIATVPIGYGDGLFKSSEEALYCLIGGKRKKVVGGICMDEIMVDVGDDDIKVGDEVVILGSQGEEKITGKDLASFSKTIVYEVITSFSNRIPKVYIENGSKTV